ncbi:MAG: hypothetical protein ACLTDI_13665 [Acutalibacteraceae bacterium]
MTDIENPLTFAPRAYVIMDRLKSSAKAGIVMDKEKKEVFQRVAARLCGEQILQESWLREKTG